MLFSPPTRATGLMALDLIDDCGNQPARHTPAMASLKVLIVEDDAMIGMLLAELLEEMGYSVCSIAVTEDNAVAEAARCKPGLMIVDQQLLKGTGRSAVQRILQNGPIPCVFISGAPEYLAKPHANVLQKPFLERDLIRAIRLVVGNGDAPADHVAAPVHAVPGH